MAIKIISIFLMLVGVGGMFIGSQMFGDIGLAAIIGSLVGLLSGIGFWIQKDQKYKS